MALKGWHISKVFGEKHIIWVTALEIWRLPTQLIIFVDFWSKILEIARPVNYSYLPPCHMEDLQLIFHSGCTSFKWSS